MDSFIFIATSCLSATNDADSVDQLVRSHFPPALAPSIILMTLDLFCCSLKLSEALPSSWAAFVLWPVPLSVPLSSLVSSSTAPPCCYFLFPVLSLNLRTSCPTAIGPMILYGCSSRLWLELLGASQRLSHIKLA